ncbi:MAG: cystathionine gamma-synthase [Ignavibacteria bacterium]|nr:cystathionine gamma-synthase [Ignavibacteria bacterium]
MKFSTKAIHVGQEPDEQTGAVTVPLYQTSTYAQEEIGKHKGWEYARTQNPTRSRWEQCLTSMEGGVASFAFASGMAAIDATLRLLSSGDHVLMAEDMYGGTFRLAERVLSRFGLTFSYIDMRDVGNVESSVLPNTRMIFTETPTNPMMSISDIGAISEIARKAGAFSVVDNTFASPYLQRPLELGADVVVHSATKYLGGHSDLVHGIVATRHHHIADQLKFLQNAAGAVPGPFECWLCLRSAKTLHVRMDRHSENALRIAAWLEQHPGVIKVYYPGLHSHPQHELAKQQMNGFGGMISIDLGSMERAVEVTKKLKIFCLAESLGGAESLVCHPVTMTHGSVPLEQRLRLGITDGLIRLSVGIEDIDDLITDLAEAL